MKTYEPEIEVARKAPAVICAVASRTFRLRHEIAKLKAQQKTEFSLREVEELLRDYLARLPFETELLSGDILQVDRAIREYPV